MSKQYFEERDAVKILVGVYAGENGVVDFAKRDVDGEWFYSVCVAGTDCAYYSEELERVAK